MPLDLQLGDVTAAGTLLEEGEYLFLIEDAELNEAAEGKTGHNLLLKMVVVEPVEMDGRMLSENLNVQKSTYPFVKRFLNALHGHEVADIRLDETELPGNKIIGVVAHVDGYANVVSWGHYED